MNKAIFLVSVALLVTGCGGGGGGGGGGENQDNASAQSAATPEQSEPTITTSEESQNNPSQTNDSTALSDNVLPSQGNFDVHKGYQLDLDLADLTFTGNQRFLKISDNKGSLLFLGQVAATPNLNLPLHIKLGALPLNVEVFTESGESHTLSLEAL